MEEFSSGGNTTLTTKNKSVQTNNFQLFRFWKTIKIMLWGIPILCLILLCIGSDIHLYTLDGIVSDFSKLRVNYPLGAVPATFKDPITHFNRNFSLHPSLSPFPPSLSIHSPSTCCLHPTTLYYLLTYGTHTVPMPWPFTVPSQSRTPCLSCS